MLASSFTIRAFSFSFPFTLVIGVVASFRCHMCGVKKAQLIYRKKVDSNWRDFWKRIFFYNYNHSADWGICMAISVLWTSFNLKHCPHNFSIYFHFSLSLSRGIQRLNSVYYSILILNSMFGYNLTFDIWHHHLIFNVSKKREFG